PSGVVSEGFGAQALSAEIRERELPSLGHETLLEIPVGITQLGERLANQRGSLDTYLPGKHRGAQWRGCVRSQGGARGDEPVSVGEGTAGGRRHQARRRRETLPAREPACPEVRAGASGDFAGQGSEQHLGS